MRNHLSVLSLASAVALLNLPTPAHAQVSAIPNSLNFQGRLATSSGNPVPDGTYSVRFSLWDAAQNGTEKWNKTVANVAVKNGVFAVTLDTFPAGTFNANLWLEVKIGSDAALSPRTPLVSVPYAMKSDLALTVPDGSLTTSKFAAGELNTAINSLAWLLNGNSGTTSSHFLGTTDGQPLVFKTNNAERLRILSDGKIGIGSSNPLQTLDVNGRMNVANGVIQRGGTAVTGTNDLGLYSQVPNDWMRFVTNNGDFRFYADGGAGTDPVMSLNTNGNISLKDDADISGLDFLVGYNDLRLAGRPSGETHLYITGNGDVGIGTTGDPGAKLEVRGNVLLKDGITIDAGGLSSDTLSSNGLRMGANNSGEGITSKRTSGGNQYGLDFYTANLNRMSITSDGKIGVGTNSPSQTLDVNGRINVTNGVIQRGGTALANISDLGLYSQVANNWLRFVTNNGDFRFYSDSGGGTNALMTLTSNGNLGIGTTTPQTKLDVNGSVKFSTLGIGTSSPQQALSVAGGLVVDQGGQNTGSLNQNGAAGYGLSFGSGSGEGIASTRSSGSNANGMDFFTNYTKRLSISNSGNIGIGNANPILPLSFGEGYGDKILLGDDRRPSGGYFSIGVQPKMLQFGSPSIDSVFAFGAGSNSLGGFVEAMRIVPGNGAGNGLRVGINTTSPEEMLHVAGSILGATGRFRPSEYILGSQGLATLDVKGGVGNIGVFVGDLSPFGAAAFVVNRSGTNKHFLHFATNGNAVFYVDQNGRPFGTGGYAELSDARYKRNVSTFENALDAILNLRGVSFEWDTEKWKERGLPTGKQIGFIAQEVEKVLPELVTTDAKGYKTVSYTDAVPVLVEAIKAQQKQREADKAEIAELKARLDAIERALAELRANR
jgi:hypothetical protein